MRFTARGVRETERPVSFIPKGALTHHPEGAVVFPLEIVRSPRGMRLLRQPYGQCHTFIKVLSSSTQSAVVSTLKTPSCLQKSVTDSFVAVMDGSVLLRVHFFFLRKRNKNQN